MDVGDVLRDRADEPGGFERMAFVSALAHGIVFALIWFAPTGWLPQRCSCVGLASAVGPGLNVFDQS